MNLTNLDYQTERRSLENSGYLDKHFDRRNDPYTTIVATTDDLLEIYYRLRYDVFCEERGMIDKQRDLLERAKSDAYAIPILLYHKTLGMFVGGVRLILPQTKLLFNGLPGIELEISPFHQQYLNQTLPFPGEKTSEISRLLISKKRMEIVRNHSLKETLNQTISPIAHLFRKIYQVSKKHNLSYFFSIQAAGLVPIMQSLSIPVIKIGSMIEYVGKRQPCYNSFENVLKYSQTHNQKLYNFYLEK